MNSGSLTLCIVVGLLVAATQLPLGLCLGWWVFQRRMARAARGSLHARRAADSLLQLRSVAERLAEHAGQHALRIEGIRDGLAQAATQDDGALHDALLAAMAQIFEENELLQNQLNSAENQLQEQARRIESHVAEARTDALTGLSNRRAFDDELDQRLEHVAPTEAPLSLMLIDIDHFKKFNDQYGHQAGDEVLRSVARVLYGAMRDSDVVARYGGEEFAIILPNTNLEEARAAAERARQAVEAGSFEFGEQRFHVTISGGVAEARPGEDKSLLVSRADEALYASKAAGRNCAFVHDGELCQPVTNRPPAETPEAEPEPPIAARSTPNEPDPIQPAQPAEEAVDARRSVDPTAAELLPRAIADWRTDPLTGLPSRKAFDEELRRSLAQHRRYGAVMSLAILDVDNLDDLTRQYGEETASVVVRAVTQFLTTAMRDADFVARYDGTRFTLLLPATSLENGVRAAERIRGAVALCRLRLGGADIQFTISAGVTEATDADDSAALLMRAEAALRSAINAGRNRTALHNGRRCFPSQFVLSPAAVD